MLVVVGLAGCTEDEPRNLEVQRIDVGYLSGFQWNYTDGVVLDTFTQWADFWQKHTSISDEPARTAVPIVDFDERFVVAIFLPHQNDTRTTVRLPQAVPGETFTPPPLTYEGEVYKIHYETITLVEPCPVPAGGAQPYEIVSIPRLNRGTPFVELEHVRHIDASDCPSA